MLSLIVILVSFVVIAQGVPMNQRIVNGNDALKGDVPYIVSVRINGRHNCGGSIMDSKHILTAAHCLINVKVEFLSIQYGIIHISSENDALNVINVEEVVIHNNFLPGNGYLNDIGMLKLKKAMRFDKYAGPIALPPAYNATPEGGDALLAGWGSPFSGGLSLEELQEVHITVFSDDYCEQVYFFIGPTDRRYHICAGVPNGGKGQCNGDSGGPLIVNSVQVGIVSWSVKPCSRPDYPGVLTKVSAYVPWILEKIDQTSWT